MDHRVIYEIVANEELPVFDATIKIKHVLLHDRPRRVFNAVMWRAKPLMMPGYLVGHCLRIGALFTPVAFGRWFALAAPACQYPVVFVTVLSFRIEYLRVIARTFDFWFFTATNILWLASAIVVFQDTRAALLPVCWLEYQNAAGMDAFFSNFSAVIVSCLVSAAMLIAWEVGISLQLIDATHRVALVSTTRHTVTAADVMANATGTILILLVRLVHRRHTLVRREWGVSYQTLQSMAYRCKVRLRERDDNDDDDSNRQGPTLQALPDASIQASASTPALETRSASGPLLIQPLAHALSTPCAVALTQITPPLAPIAACAAPPIQRQLPKKLAMRFVQVHTTFDAADIIAPWLRSKALPVTSVPMVALYTIGIASPALTLALDVVGATGSSNAYPQHHVAADVLASATLVATVVFCSQFVGLYQRELLRRVCRSFEFLFLSFQLTFASVGMCDLLQWQAHRCAAILASWIWMHWVMTLDALTPTLRRTLAFHIKYAAPVLLVRLALQCVLMRGVIEWDDRRLNLRDRVLVRGVLAGRSIAIHLLPFVVSRAVTNVVWCVRLLWRIWRRHSDDELIMLQGNVEYDCVRQRPKASSRRLSVAATLARIRKSRLLSSVTMQRMATGTVAPSDARTDSVVADATTRATSTASTS